MDKKVNSDIFECLVIIRDFYDETGELKPEYERSESVRKCYIHLDLIEFWYDDTENASRLAGNKVRLVFQDDKEIVIMEDIDRFTQIKREREEFLYDERFRVRFN